MATTVTLQSYLNELNNLLENESATEVVSHCRYILQHYPQNVETYRLLGKALLQKGQHEGSRQYMDEAAEVFQRVLSVVPNDATAHLGLSEIRADQKALDQALWHLERAYEQMPSNTVLQEALRDLYARREGGSSSEGSAKVQLTRGALARQYANGRLYDQALLEIRAALEQSPGRADLMVLLAETLWDSQHHVEAAETAVEILNKLPNCLPANRILARLWMEYERPTDAQVFLSRIEALDPYEAARLLQGGAPLVDPNRITRLDYSARAAASLSAETPEWVQDLDDYGSMNDVFPAAPRAPEFEPFAPQGTEAGGRALFGDEPEAAAGPDWMDSIAASADQDLPDWYGGSGVDFTPPAPALPTESTPPIGADWLEEVQPSAPAPGGQGEFPEWFAEVMSSEPAPAPSPEQPVEADWLPLDEDSSAPPPAPSGFTGLLHDIEASRSAASFEESIESAEPPPPDWIAAFDEAGKNPTAEEVSPPEPAAPAVNPLAWLDEEDEGFLDETPPESEASAFAAPEEAVVEDDDWFAAFEAARSATAPIPAAPAEEAGSDLGWGALVEPPPAEEAHEWSAAAPEAPADQEAPTAWMDADTLFGEAGPPAEEDLLSALEADQYAPHPPAITPDEVESWEAALGMSQAEPPVSVLGPEAETRGAAPDFAPAEESADFLAPAAQPAESEAFALPSTLEASLAPAEAPDWMQETAPEVPAVPEAELPAEEVPAAEGDWLAEWGQAEAETAEAPSEELAPAEMPDWMQQMAPAVPAAPEAELPSEEVPAAEGDWLAEWGQAEAETAEAPSAELAPAEMPDWMQQMALEVPAVPEAELPAAELPAEGDWLAEWGQAEAETVEAPSEELAPAEMPDWMQPMAPEVPAVSEAELPAAELPAEGDWLAEWGQAEAETLETPSEELAPAEMPNWMQQMAPEVPAVPEAELPAAELPTEGDWLAEWGQGEAETVEAPSAELAPAEMPDWMQQMAPEVPAVPEAELPAEETPAEWEAEASAIMPEAPTLEADFMALFDMPAVEAPTAEPEAAGGLDWLQPADTAGEDWLDSFALPETPAVEPAAELPAALGEEEPTAEDWLAAIPDLGSTPLEEITADEAQRFTEPQAESLETAGEAAVEEPWLAELEIPSIPELPAEEPSAEPAWLAELAPLPGSDLPLSDEEGPAQPGDQLPSSAMLETAEFLALDEEPDWMKVLSGEEVPPEEEAPQAVEWSADFLAEPEEAAPAWLEPEAGPAPEELATAVPDQAAEVEPLADETWSVEQGAAESLPGEVEAAVPAPEEGGMPDWLAAITSSGAQNLDEMFPAEEEPYLSAEETGVLQPGTAPDWLVELEASEAELAQPGEIAHTREVTPEMEADLEDEPVPEDFSFDDLTPAWLRRPQEGSQGATRPASPGGSPETPEWLRTIFEEDESLDSPE